MYNAVLRNPSPLKYIYKKNTKFFYQKLREHRKATNIDALIINGNHSIGKTHIGQHIKRYYQSLFESNKESSEEITKQRNDHFSTLSKIKRLIPKIEQHESDLTKDQSQKRKSKKQ